MHIRADALPRAVVTFIDPAVELDHVLGHEKTTSNSDLPRPTGCACPSPGACLSAQRCLHPELRYEFPEPTA